MGISAKPTIDVCLVTTKHKNLHSLALNTHSKIAEANPDVNFRLWAYDGARSFLDLIRGSDMGISTIPEITVVPDRFLFGSAGVAMPIFYESGIYQRHISDFQYFVADSIFEYASKHNAIACMSRWAEVKDDAIVLGFNTSKQEDGPMGTVCGTRMGSYRAKNPDVIRILKYHMTRNTAPLIVAELSRLMTKDCKMVASGIMPRSMLNAANIQHFYRCQENPYARDQSPLSLKVPEAYIRERKKNSKGIPVETIFDQGCMASMLLEKMHPSAEDPKFEERTKGWIEDWPASKSVAEKWIKTWSGRLRRRQAVRYKEAMERSEFIGGVIASLADPKPVSRGKIGCMTRISSAISAYLQDSERQIYEEVAASVQSIVSGFPKVEIPEKIRIEYEISKAVSATMYQIEIWESGSPIADADRILQELPPAWADGASFAKRMFDAGRDSVVSMLSG